MSETAYLNLTPAAVYTGSLCFTPTGGKLGSVGGGRRDARCENSDVFVKPDAYTFIWKY